MTAADFVAGLEGLRLAAYQDQAGVWTIGYGHTAGVTEGMTCTPAQALGWLGEDLHAAATCIAKSVHVALTNDQQIALTSFVYNVGCDAFMRSTLLRNLNAGDYIGAAKQMLLWVHVNEDGHFVVSSGLVNRREKEYTLFTGSDNAT